MYEYRITPTLKELVQISDLQKIHFFCYKPVYRSTKNKTKPNHPSPQNYPLQFKVNLKIIPRL